MKYCRTCGKKLKDEDMFCSACGNACTEPEEEITDEKNEQLETAPTQKSYTNGFAIAGFVLSFLFPLFGWIFGGIGLSKAHKNNGVGEGLSIAALFIATILFFITVAINLSTPNVY
ncbi:MAG: zinc-ribbon domain-containing protein [Clostridia bacterium]|nr:zinc-ribbon domain-containing protein [Clostridia bacterium]